jgi:ADP-ribose pyrophosphatase YjhB (NUDIX family)
MRMTASSIVTNEAGELLLIQRDDIRTFDVPGGGMDPGELPPEAAARETFEETGLRVRPSQLLGIYHWPNEPHAFLSFYFRCELLGGTIQTSEETPSVAFVAPNALPSRILPMHRQRIRHSLAHVGEQPLCLAQPMTLTQKAGKKVLGRILFPLQRWRRRRGGQQPWPEPEPWQMAAFTIIRNAAGAVLWIKRMDKDLWNLPGGDGNKRNGGEIEEAPWETAVRETHNETGCQVRLCGLTSIKSYTNQAKLTFNFTAKIMSGQLTTGLKAAAFAWFQPGAEPANAIPQHCECVADAFNGSDGVVFRKQDGRIS